LRAPAGDEIAGPGGGETAVRATSGAWAPDGGGNGPAAAIPALEQSGTVPAPNNQCQRLDDISTRVVERRIEPGLGVIAMVDDEAGRRVEVRVGEWGLGDGSPVDRVRDGVESEPPTLQAGGRAWGGWRPGAGPVAGPRRDAAGPAGYGDGKPVFVFVSRVHAATIELRETWRAGLDAALRDLKALHVETAVLTGDALPPAGRFPGVIVRSGMTPAGKHEHVAELAASGRCVIFVGDGVNDAAAMGAAQGSIAMQSGADLAHAAAMAVSTGSDLRFLPRAIAIARAARRSIRINLWFAAAYNIAGMALAAAGMLHPVAAALLMVGSSAFVSVNALRAR